MRPWQTAVMASMLGKLACMRLRSGRHLKPGREKRIYKRAQRAREKKLVKW